MFSTCPSQVSVILWLCTVVWVCGEGGGGFPYPAFPHLCPQFLSFCITFTIQYKVILTLPNRENVLLDAYHSRVPLSTQYNYKSVPQRCLSQPFDLSERTRTTRKIVKCFPKKSFRVTYSLFCSILILLQCTDRKTNENIYHNELLKISVHDIRFSSFEKILYHSNGYIYIHSLNWCFIA